MIALAATTNVDANCLSGKTITVTGDKVCKDCGETVEAGKVIPATGAEVDPPKTGDMTVLIATAAVLALIGMGVIVSKKRSTAC